VRARSPLFFVRRSFWRRSATGYVVRDQREQVDQVAISSQSDQREQVDELAVSSQTDVTCEPVPAELAAKNLIT